MCEEDEQAVRADRERAFEREMPAVDERHREAHEDHDADERAERGSRQDLERFASA